MQVGERCYIHDLLLYFIARFSVRVPGVVAQDCAATPHGLPSPPSFRLGKVPSDSIQDPQYVDQFRSKSNLSLYSVYYAKACNETNLRDPSPRHCARETQLFFEEISQQ